MFIYNWNPAKVAHYSDIIIISWEFYTPALANGLSQESEWQLVPRTHFSVLADLNNTVVWIVSTCFLISKFSISFTQFLRIVPSAPITIGITVTIMFHSVFSSLARSRYCDIYCIFVPRLHYPRKTGRTSVKVPYHPSSKFSVTSYILLIALKAHITG